MIKNIENILKDKELKIELIKSVNLDDETFNTITSSTLTTAEFIYLSANNSLNQKQINYLFNENIDNVNINLLRNIHCPEEKINEFIKLNDKIYNITIAHNKALTKTHIKKLLKFNDSDVIMSLKFNNLL